MQRARSDRNIECKNLDPSRFAPLFSNANGIGLLINPVPSAGPERRHAADLEESATGLFKLTIGVQKSSDLIQFSPFPLTAPQTTINGQGELEFQFSVPDNAAFFRLETR